MNKVEQCRYGKMIYSDSDAYVGRSLDLYGEYSIVEAQLLAKCVHEGDTVIEVGANIGALTVPLAQKVGPAGMVFAFEPQRMTYYALCGNVFLNNLQNTFCFQRALSDEPGITLIPDLDYDLPGNYGAFSMVRETAIDAVIKNKVPVEVNRLDDFDIQFCHLLKVDVEGMELQVLKGGISLISIRKPILYVENDRDDNREELRAWIKDQGYELWQHFPPLYSEGNYVGSHENAFAAQVSANILAWHKDSGLTRESFAEFDLHPGDVKFTVSHHT